MAPRRRDRTAAHLLLWAAALALPGTVGAQAPRLTLELEAGPAWQSYNDVQIPNDGSATRFSLAELAGRGPWPAGRLYLTWNRTESQSVRLLLAPFTLTESGVPRSPLRFAGSAFAAGVPVKATYTFNSYRLTYRWRVHSGERSRLWVGFTAKLRDATIQLEQGATSARKDDIGFVPLLHVAAERSLTPRWGIGLDADALAGGPGRAEDVALKVGYDPGHRWSIQGGYRIVEGGADVPAVYTFAWLHYAVASVRLRW